MSSLTSYLPQPPRGGLLPYWLLFISATGVYNIVQNHFVLWQTKEIYSKKAPEVTPLAARLFATWTAVSVLVRTQAAYHISNPAVYDLCIATYALASWHAASEFLIFRSMKLTRANLPILIVAHVSLVWMLSQRKFYLGL